MSGVARGLPAAVGRYEIVARLATGGMAEILLGRLRGPSGFERPVVIKRLLPHLAENRAFIDMFLDEARLVARIRHPNVVQVQDLAVEGDDAFLVMEYLEGETVGTLLRRLTLEGEWLEPALVAHVVAEAAAGLHAAHEARDADDRPSNLVHRDVSPQNIFVTYDGAVKLLDFGIAKADARAARTETGQIKGKFAYMSPEQAQGLPLDRRSDVFSLGAVLYELGTGRGLFLRATEAATLKAVLEEPLVPPSRITSSFPPVLDAVCLKALERDRDARYATAAALRADLLAALETLDAPPAPGEALARVQRRLFGDRIAETRERLRRAAEASPAGLSAASPASGGSGASGAAAASSTATAAGAGRPVRAAALAAALVAVAAAAAAITWLVRAPGSARDGRAVAVAADCASPRVTIADFGAEWATPRAIRWTWDADGDAGDLLRFELVVGTDAGEVAARAESPDAPAPRARVWTEADRPELGRLEVPRTVRVHRVAGTLTDGHSPDTVYHARVVAIDSRNCRAPSRPVARRTSVAPWNGLEIVPGAPPAGPRALPRAYAFVENDAPAAGAPGRGRYEYRSSCPPGQTACYENLKLEALGHDLAPITPGAFAQAYLEVVIECLGAGPSFYSSVALCFDGRCDGACKGDCTAGCETRCEGATQWQFRPFSIACTPAGGRRVIEVPLRGLRAAIDYPCNMSMPHAPVGCPLTPATLGKRLWGLWLSGMWPAQAVVRLHEARLRW